MVLQTHIAQDVHDVEVTRGSRSASVSGAHTCTTERSSGGGGSRSYNLAGYPDQISGSKRKYQLVTSEAEDAACASASGEDNVPVVRPTVASKEKGQRLWCRAIKKPEESSGSGNIHVLHIKVLSTVDKRLREEIENMDKEIDQPQIPGSLVHAQLSTADSSRESIAPRGGAQDTSRTTAMLTKRPKPLVPHPRPATIAPFCAEASQANLGPLGLVQASATTALARPGPSVRESHSTPVSLGDFFDLVEMDVATMALFNVRRNFDNQLQNEEHEGALFEAVNKYLAIAN